MKTLPARIFVCPVCGYHTVYRWVLANHLQHVHDLSRKDAKGCAVANEYLANPRYYKATDSEYDEEDENID